MHALAARHPDGARFCLHTARERAGEGEQTDGVRAAVDHSEAHVSSVRALVPKQALRKLWATSPAASVSKRRMAE